MTVNCGYRRVIRLMRVNRGLFMVVAATVLRAQTGPVTLTPAADSYIQSGQPNQNNAASTFLRVQDSGNNRALVRFDQAAIANAIGTAGLASAKLRLYISVNGNNWGSNGGTVGAHRMLPNWTESGATWNCPADTNPANSSPDCLPDWKMNEYSNWPFQQTPTHTTVHANNQTGWVEWDVTADVAAFLAGAAANYGWIVRKMDESSPGKADYSSREGSFPPQLVLTPGTPPAPPPPSATMVSSSDTYLKSGSPNSSQGYETVLTVQSNGNNRALVQFSQASISAYVGASSLISAKLRLYILSNGNNWGPSGGAVNAHRLTATWTEPGATWNCPNDTNPLNGTQDCTPGWSMAQSSQWPFASTATASISHQNNQSAWVEWDVTADVAAFLAGSAQNYGWIVKKADESQSGRVDYSSREGTFPPVLVLTTATSISISVSPPTVSLNGGQTQQFTANVTGLANTAVSWTINPPTAGFISAAGLYTAPTSITSQQMVTVTTTSQADPTRTANATIALNPPVTISAAPSTITLSAGQTHHFQATVSGNMNTAVTWSLGAGAAGSISTTGLYTAPTSITSQQTATVIATSQADSTKTASAVVTLNPVAVSVAPVGVSLTGGQTQQFTASVLGTANTTVNWTITPAGTGSITGTGLYAAPATVTSPRTVTITAASVAFPGKTASVTVSLNPPAATGGISLLPNVLNLVVGETRTLQALDAAGNPVTGLSWMSTDSNIVSLSTDNPPELTAVAPGHVTIAAGGGSADVTVHAGPLPVGTVIWSNPATGSTGGIVPAVPSPSGLADVFAAQNVFDLTQAGNIDLNGRVQAITSDGTMAWSTNINESALPDFQGGLIELLFDSSSPRGIARHTGIVKIDGITGQRHPVYTPDLSGDPLTTPGSGPLYPRFGLGTQLDVGVHTDGTVFITEYHLNPNCDPETPCQQGFVVGIDPVAGTKKFAAPIAGKNPRPFHLMIAGDGFAYLPYWHEAGSTKFLNLLRVSSTGEYNDISVSQSAQVFSEAAMITNADTGILITWLEGLQAKMAKVSGTGVQLVSAPVLGSSGQLTYPVLQAQDGSFVGNGYDANWNGHMVAFDANGTIRWTVPNKVAQIATADGDVIATNGDGSAAVRYDQSGTAVEQIGALYTQSWTGNVYRKGSVEQLVASPVPFAPSFFAFQGGNQSRNNTAHFRKDSKTNDKVREKLTSAFWSKFGKSNCGAVFGNQLGVLLMVPTGTYSLRNLQIKQARTNFYDIGNSGIGDYTLQEVTGGEIKSGVLLRDRVASVNAITDNWGFEKVTAVILKPTVLAGAHPQFTLVHEIVFHAFAAKSDDTVFAHTYFQEKGLWRPSGSTASVNISTWMGTDCKCTPGNPAAPTCQADTATW